MATNNAVNISSSGLVDYNGTGTFSGISHVNNSVLTAGAAGTPVFTSLATDGQLIIGSSAGAPAAATLTAGTNITITNANNSITIAASGATTQTTGTWTPTLVGSVTAGSTSYTTQQGYYINTGVEVWALCFLDCNPGGTASGTAIFGGLPFTVKNQANGNTPSAGVASSTATAYTTSIAGYTGILNTTTAQLQKYNTAGAASAFVLITATTEVLAQFTLIFQK